MLVIYNDIHFSVVPTLCCRTTAVLPATEATSPYSSDRSLLRPAFNSAATGSGFPKLSPDVAFTTTTDFASRAMIFSHNTLEALRDPGATPSPRQPSSLQVPLEGLEPSLCRV